MHNEFYIKNSCFMQYILFLVDYRAHAECTQDSDCPSKTGCINRKCQDPCSLPAVCAFDQECRVQDTLPMRTVLCVCPPDTIASIDGHCRPISTYDKVIITIQMILKPFL